jgi:hypothetical protein
VNVNRRMISYSNNHSLIVQGTNMSPVFIFLVLFLLSAAFFVKYCTIVIDSVELANPWSLVTHIIPLRIWALLELKYKCSNKDGHSHSLHAQSSDM